MLSFVSSVCPLFMGMSYGKSNFCLTFYETFILIKVLIKVVKMHFSNGYCILELYYLKSRKHTLFLQSQSLMQDSVV